MRSWVEPKGLLKDPQQHPVFGFNNPSPSFGQKAYGYEFWICVDPDTQPEDDIKIKDFPGGLYAVTSCKLDGDPLGAVPEIWRKLWEWVQSSEYQWRQDQELEKLQQPLAPLEDMILELYLPIEEK